MKIKWGNDPIHSLILSSEFKKITKKFENLKNYLEKIVKER